MSSKGKTITTTLIDGTPITIHVVTVKAPKQHRVLKAFGNAAMAVGNTSVKDVVTGTHSVVTKASKKVSDKRSAYQAEKATEQETRDFLAPYEALNQK